MASPAVYMFCLPRKAAIRSAAEMVSIMTAHVSCGRQGWADPGVTRSQGHRTMGWILGGRNKSCFGSKTPNLGIKSRAIGKFRKGRCSMPCPFPSQLYVAYEGWKRIGRGSR
jgi:hypothetical protein